MWCNPPFSRLEAWVAKAWEEVKDGCPLVVMLIPANRCEQPFWQTFIEPHRDRLLPNGIRLTTKFVAARTKFVAPHTATGMDSPPFGCVLLTWIAGGADTP